MEKQGMLSPDETEGAEVEQARKREDTHYSHHSCSSHSRHNHHSQSNWWRGSRSHQRKHRTTHSKKKNKQGRIFLVDRIQAWLDKKMSRKSLVTVSVLFLLLAIVFFLGFSEYIDAQNQKQDGGSMNPSVVEPNAISPQAIEVPMYWEDMIEQKSLLVNALQMEGGLNSVSFVWASDTHIPDNHTARTNNIGALMAKMLDNCSIPFAVLTGDVGTRSSVATEEELDNMIDQISKHLSPLWGTDRLLMALGNHDGCYGDETGYYRKQLSPEKLWETYFREQALDFRRVFSEESSYFFVDNTPQKIRFIVLNSQYGGNYAVDEIGWAINDRFAVSCYGQEQLDWLANVALDMPEGYGAVIATHVPPKVLYSTQTEPYTVDCAQLRGIIDAYNNRTTFSGRYTVGVDGWNNSVIDVDFTDAMGEVIALFAGHIHQDSVDTTTMSCPIITITSAGAPVNTGDQPERIFGTDTETSFDVVTINRKTRTIHCTRIGAGEDRTIPY